MTLDIRRLRFVDEIVTLLAAHDNSCTTFKQFQANKLDTVVGNLGQGKRVFLKMAFDKLKELKKGAHAWRGLAVGVRGVCCWLGLQQGAKEDARGAEEDACSVDAGDDDGPDRGCV